MLRISDAITPASRASISSGLFSLKHTSRGLSIQGPSPCRRFFYFQIRVRSGPANLAPQTTLPVGDDSVAWFSST
jgi:hypothetical protein